MIRKSLALALSSSIVLSGCTSTTGTPPGNGSANTTPTVTITPTTQSAAIKHVVVIFGENVSFDHYFGTYPNALNLPGETKFTAATGTPTTTNNYVSNPGLLTDNPNSGSQNGAGAANPFRLSPSQAATADQDHGYTAEQSAFDGGKMDLFPTSVGSADSATLATSTGASAIAATTGLTMGYFDGNTATVMWNYAQHYALNDRSFGTNFGPSTPGAINLISGQTNGVVNTVNPGGAVAADGNGGLTLVGDADPTGDICSSTTKSASLSGKNIGDLLNAKSLTWGWFEGGFDLTVTNSNGTTGCKRSSTSAYTGTVADYVPHHQPFQYYASTQNLNHTRPTSVAAIGTTDAANHQYDTHDFTDALAAGNLPAVSFLKAPSYQDGHAGYSDPIDEGTFVATMVNAIEKSSFWPNTAIIFAYDDSDGWYDHVAGIVNGSVTTADTLNGAGVCGSTSAAAAALPGLTGTAPAQGRCGYGPRLPLLVLSPWVKKNYIDDTTTDQSSITRFIEDTFLSSERIGGGSFDSIAGTLSNMFDFSNAASPPNPNVVQLNPATGVVTSGN
ncbi:phospholipase C [Granulicella arctica]|uniref:Phospholipase C n=1 Tax=Granulicella arctica TaxID=940613 RepID=A0A7Y9PEE3_9BACT|nr:alkaline phosphatase family protein [Granulicella arctica]NYF78398.1 phospholipase C [Granulicella arctica]